MHSFENILSLIYIRIFEVSEKRASLPDKYPAYKWEQR